MRMQSRLWRKPGTPGHRSLCNTHPRSIECPVKLPDGLSVMGVAALPPTVSICERLPIDPGTLEAGLVHLNNAAGDSSKLGNT